MMDSEKLKFDFSKIGFKEIEKDANLLLDKFTPVSHNILLNKLLENIQEVDYRGKANLVDEFSKLTKKHLLVITIEEIKRVAIENNWGLCTFNGEIFIFNGAFWQEIPRSEFEQFLCNAAIKMGTDPYESKHFEYKTLLCKQFLSDSLLQKSDTENRNVLVNLKNGTYEFGFENQSIRGFQRADFMRYQLPFEFKTESECPMFFKYLEEVLPDIQCQKVLSEYVAYLFVSPSYLKLEKALVLFGKGANGKSVFFEILMALLGSENVSNYSLQSLTEVQGYQRAKIANKLVNYASELTSRMNVDLFKQLVSGEPIGARLPFKEPFILKNYAKLVFNCNELPKDVEPTDAFFRRFLIIPFEVQISPEKQDPELARKIIDSELSGVFNWILEGLKRLLYQKRFSKCQASENALTKYKTESNSVKLFLFENNFNESINNFIYLKDLYSEYCEFCKFGNYRACSNKTFSERLRGDGIVLERRKAGFVAFLEKKVLETITSPTPFTPSDVSGVVDVGSTLSFS